ncbi:Zn-ribbon domain-containing OB-fold protein [Azospirillum sp.]|uniref:Zn-ribbon domain-containing OB-fold protein n=1 Tax=Azospirillum sp. TaxID=34012 RepID=UPI002D614CE2|nr:OB-fold domain-containing protein [Azospirillum sp.]HYD70089.1 OB-fold domain-containing protein [Azospirillum sp.]
MTAPTALPPELGGAYRVVDGDRVVLLAGRGGVPRALAFPRRAWSAGTLDPVEPVEVAATGRVYSHTLVCVKPPYGLPTPYAVGYVDIDGTGLRVFGLFDPQSLDALVPGLRVELVARRLGVGNDGNECLRPVFRCLENAA